MPRRAMYKEKRYSAFLGLHITPEMQSELAREAAHALRPKSEFIRYLLEEGLKSWRFRDLRAVKESA